MNVPGLTAEHSLGKPTRAYRGQSHYGERPSSTSAQPAFVPLDQSGGVDGDLNDLDSDAGDGTALMDEGAEEDGETVDIEDSNVGEDLDSTNMEAMDTIGVEDVNDMEGSVEQNETEGEDV